MSVADDTTGPVDLVDEPAVWASLRPYLRPVTLVDSKPVSAALGAEVLIASEAFQHTGSFKLRAAMAAALQYGGPHLLAGSSGNFGAALAYACKRLGIRCTIVMPHDSSTLKIDAVRGHGAEVDLVDTRVTARKERIRQLASSLPGVRVVSAFDDPFVIAGNASLGMEIFAVDQPDIVIAAVGGGGLCSGLIHARTHSGATAEMWAAEPALCNDASRSLRAGVLSHNDHEADTLCDGARTLSLGQRNFAILRRGLAGVVEVSEENVVAAVRLLSSHANLKAEPTGALSVGALLQEPARFAGKKVVCVVSGGNVSPDVYARLLA